MGLLRELFWVAAHNNFTIRLVHVPGKCNAVADALSRNLMTRFFALAPQADPQLSAIPSHPTLPRSSVTGLCPVLGVDSSFDSRYIWGWDLAVCDLLLPPPFGPRSGKQAAGGGLCISSSAVSLPTIRLYLAAVTFWHHTQGLCSPVFNNPTLRLPIRGIRRSQAECLPKRCRLPISPQILTLLRGAVDADTSMSVRDHRLLRAAMSLAFYGFLRVGEFMATPLHRVPLRRRDVWFVGHQLDQWGRGTVVSVGCSVDSSCLVSSMKRYLKCCPAPSSSPLFIWDDGSPLTARRFRSQLWVYFGKLGLDPYQFNTHSFRIGAVTTAAKVGISSGVIKQLGRWRSRAFKTYIRCDPQHAAAAAVMAKCQD